MNLNAECVVPLEQRLVGLITRHGRALLAVGAIVLAITIVDQWQSRASVSVVSKRGGTQLARMADEISVRAAGRGNPWINLSDGREIITDYNGPADLKEALELNRARPLSLCCADFDEDGVPDLICGYAGPSGGIITLLRGNVDSIYPNAPEANLRRAEGVFTEAPFLSPALVFGAPEAADFIGAGDFDGDSHWDVAAAARGSNNLYLLSGNGSGGLSQTKKVALPGRVTAMVVGEINRRDGLDDIVVGVAGADGPMVLVFEGPQGALRARPENLDLPAEAASLALGQLDDSYEMDLAVAAGNDLLIVHGRDRKLSLDESRKTEVRPPAVDCLHFPFALKSLAIGSFTGSRDLDIALLSDDGKTRLLCHDRPMASAASAWKVKERAPGNWSQRAVLVRARVSSIPVDDIVLVDQAISRVEILAAETDKGPNDRNTVSAALDLTSEPVTVLPMRLNGDALNDLVIARSGHSSVTILLTQPLSTFRVTNTDDGGPGSMRQAILDANADAGADAITFSIGSGVRTISPASRLPIITHAVTIDATTQPGFAGLPVIELNGGGRKSNGTIVQAGNSTVRGLAINRFDPGITFSVRGGNIIEGNLIGTDVTGTVAQGNSFGVFTIDSPGNTIGGTTAAARNVISGNSVDGVQISESSSSTTTETKVLGNFIGTNVAGTVAVGNGNVGVNIVFLPFNNTVGGTTAGARNVISGNQYDVEIEDSSGNLVQGNFIGTDATGSSALGSSGIVRRNGVYISGVDEPTRGNTIGGTTASTRNIISGQTFQGVLIASSEAAENLIQGNYIGTDVSGTLDLGNQQGGVNVEGFANDNTIDSNLIAFNRFNGIRLPSVEAAVRITIRSNLILTTGAIPIDLNGEGVTPNDDRDGDAGANELQNFPVLTSAITFINSDFANGAVVPSTSATVTGKLNSSPNSTFTLEFFFGLNCQASSHRFTGAIPSVLSAIQVMTDNDGNAPFTYTFEIPNGFGGGYVNSTATDSVGNTSEFSACIAVGNPNAPAVTGVFKQGKNLIVAGQNFDDGAKVLVNDEKRKTAFDSSSELIGKKVGKTIQSGDKVRVRNSDGSMSNELVYP